MKQFYIKLISITLAVIIILNVIYNLFIGESINKLNQVLSLSERDTRIEIKNKIRNEISSALEKENIMAEEDKILLFKFYKKILNEFETISQK